MGSVTENISRDASTVLGIGGLYESINSFLGRIEKHILALCGSFGSNTVSTDDMLYAAEYYYLFRRVHKSCAHLPVRSILVGDYFYSRFLQALNRIGRADLTLLFAAELRRDTQEDTADYPAGRYLDFLEEICRRISEKQGAADQTADRAVFPPVFIPDMLRCEAGSLQDLEILLTPLSDCTDRAVSDGLTRILQAGGKRLRPQLCRICYSFGERPAKPVLPLLYMLELMHTASLIHDDVIDEAPIRRGVPTIHETYGCYKAVMSGDYLLGMLMEALPYYYGTGINEEIASVAIRMCGGEFTQLDSRFHVNDQTTEWYYTQIRNKTAYLLAISCSTGGTAAGLSGKAVQALYEYGEQIGIAFQIRDDILDFKADPAFGKEKAKDLRSGIYTLPLLYAFGTHPDPEMIRLAETKDRTDEELARLIGYAYASGGVAYAQECIEACSRRAAECLADLPDGEPKEQLIRLSASLCDRKL